MLRFTRTMTTVANLQRISAKALSEQILAEQGLPAEQSTIAIIDVRDNDYIGGHIKGSTNVPVHQLDAMMPTLLRRLRDKKTVVFHCMLSQQRGPGSALRYIREREDQLRAQGGSPDANSQTVYVLDLGFSGWQQQYAEDERLTEGYRKELWDED